MGRDYPHFRLEDLSIILVEAGPRSLTGFDPKLSDKTLLALEQMGVTVKLNNPVSAVRQNGVMVGNEWVSSANVIWAAGNKASPLLNTLEAPQDSYGRVKVGADPQSQMIPGSSSSAIPPSVLAANPLPDIAPVAMRDGQYLAGMINQELLPEHRSPFACKDRGMLAMIASGPLIWVLWCIVHVLFSHWSQEPSTGDVGRRGTTSRSNQARDCSVNNQPTFARSHPTARPTRAQPRTASPHDARRNSGSHSPVPNRNLSVAVPSYTKPYSMEEAIRLSQDARTQQHAVGGRRKRNAQNGLQAGHHYRRRIWRANCRTLYSLRRRDPH